MSLKQIATEALDIHTGLINDHGPGTVGLDIIESLLDPASDPKDKRFGYEKELYAAAGGTFSGYIRRLLSEAATYTATPDKMMDIQLTMEMLQMEGIEWLPLDGKMLPAPTGVMLFPHGVEHVDHFSAPMSQIIIKGKPYLNDRGGGDRWFIDGFMWATTEAIDGNDHGWRGSLVSVISDGVVEPKDGIHIFPLTKWRGRAEDRPFRLHVAGLGQTPPPWTISDQTAWAFDEDIDDAKKWSIPEEILMSTEAVEGHGYTKDPGELAKEIVIDLKLTRWLLRSLVWSTFRWLNAEIPVPARADRPAARRRRRANTYTGPESDEVIYGDVKVMELRRERKVSQPGEPGVGNWQTTRWLVAGHKALRRYAIRDELGKSVGPTTGPNAVEGVTYYLDYVFIAPFENGPKWAPLVIRPKVGVLDK